MRRYATYNGKVEPSGKNPKTTKSPSDVFFFTLQHLKKRVERVAMSDCPPQAIPSRFWPGLSNVAQNGHEIQVCLHIDPGLIGSQNKYLIGMAQCLTGKDLDF